jgi:triacylglycerol lipase
VDVPDLAHPYRLGLALLAAAATLFVVGVLVYVFGSFLLMRAHTGKRPLGAMLREAARETFWSLLVQPLIPLLYVVGRRMGGARSGRPIVLVHGYTQNRANFLGLARALGRAGLGPLYGFNYPWHRDIEQSAASLGRFIDGVLAESKRDEVDLVTHSMGGLVALEYMQSAKPPRVRRVVTIAGPHGGVAWRGPLIGRSGASMRSGAEFITGRSGRKVGVPVLSIYSSHDNIVYPPTTSSLTARGGEDAMISAAGHLAILFDPAVARAVADFLKKPDAAAAVATAPAPGAEGAAALSTAAGATEAATAGETAPAGPAMDAP